MTAYMIWTPADAYAAQNTRSRALYLSAIFESKRCKIRDLLPTPQLRCIVKECVGGDPIDKVPLIPFIYDFLATDMKAVDAVIRARLVSEVALVRQVAEYFVGGGGKCLRLI